MKEINLKKISFHRMANKFDTQFDKSMEQVGTGSICMVKWGTTLISCRCNYKIPSSCSFPLQASFFFFFFIFIPVLLASIILLQFTKPAFDNFFFFFGFVLNRSSPLTHSLLPSSLTSLHRLLLKQLTTHCTHPDYIYWKATHRLQGGPYHHILLRPSLCCQRQSDNI